MKVNTSEYTVEINGETVDFEDFVFEVKYIKNIEIVIEKELVSRGRWTLSCRRIVRYIPDDTYFELRWTEGATEGIDYGDIGITQVYPRTITTTEYTYTKPDTE